VTMAGQGSQAGADTLCTGRDGAGGGQGIHQHLGWRRPGLDDGLHHYDPGKVVVASGLGHVTGTSDKGREGYTRDAPTQPGAETIL
jgi:hypothetical protein